MNGGTTYEKEECGQLILGIPTPIEKRLLKEFKPKKKKVILLAGPTGSGKTALSLILAQHLDQCEIISADSMQIYRGMDIGTAKATFLERQSVPHHLIDIRNVNEPFNVVDFYYEARRCLEEILARGHCPLIVGGAGFYFHALLYGPPSGPPSVPQARKALEDEIESSGLDALYFRLQQQDPDYAATITRGDRHKIVRALEIIMLTHEPVSKLSWKCRSPPLDYDYHCWFVYRPRETLYKRIEKRCEQMLSDGLLQEVAALKEKGLLENPSAHQAIGYRQCLEFLETSQSPEEYSYFLEKFKQASRHYAKKQFTWFKKEPSFRWLNIELHDLETAADMILQDYNSSW